ncbi:hypothetical protein [Anaeromyxobacter oryzae]|uniref:hypothetical protein n=1 Tax=Anaeromyxobacter oryzae TaxID=2918170 RepID=UPI0020C0D079|nr:hypothetical protein [Anaeromyxobacter oryzae]
MQVSTNALEAGGASSSTSTTPRLAPPGIRPGAPPAREVSRDNEWPAHGAGFQGAAHGEEACSDHRRRDAGGGRRVRPERLGRQLRRRERLRPEQHEPGWQLDLRDRLLRQRRLDGQRLGRQRDAGRDRQQQRYDDSGHLRVVRQRRLDGLRLLRHQHRHHDSRQLRVAGGRQRGLDGLRHHGQQHRHGDPGQRRVFDRQRGLDGLRHLGQQHRHGDSGQLRVVDRQRGLDGLRHLGQ